MLGAPPPPPQTGLRIIALTGAGTSTVTVTYTNTLPSGIYRLLYNTNLSATNWYTVGTKIAAGPSDQQTDATATSAQRYYRVAYLGQVPTAALSITGVIGVGTGNVTVAYTNTVAGFDYVLASSTNLSTTNWQVIGTKTAPATSDTQTDNAPATTQRFYRVYYAIP